MRIKKVYLTIANHFTNSVNSEIFKKFLTPDLQILLKDPDLNLPQNMWGILIAQDKTLLTYWRRHVITHVFKTSSNGTHEEAIKLLIKSNKDSVKDRYTKLIRSVDWTDLISHENAERIENMLQGSSVSTIENIGLGVVACALVRAFGPELGILLGYMGITMTNLISDILSGMAAVFLIEIRPLLIYRVAKAFKNVFGSALNRARSVFASDNTEFKTIFNINIATHSNTFEGCAA